MTLTERHNQVQSYLGKIVSIEIDRPIGYEHHKGNKTLLYPINYGYIPNVFGGDDEELDVYLIGVNQTVKSYTGRIIGIVYRSNDVEDKLVMAPIEEVYTADEIANAVFFQEKYYNTTIESLDGSKAHIASDQNI